MAEHNRHTLENALQQLPQYDPPASLWPQIEAGLEENGAATGLSDALKQLPAYQPPLKYGRLWSKPCRKNKTMKQD